MPVTVSHVLSATTPDDPKYEIRPSHWNSVHAASFSATAGTEIYGAFSNDPAYNVSFSTNGGGQVVASANVTAAPSPVNVTGNGSSVNAQTIAFTNANGLTLGVSTAAGAATVTGSYTVPTQTVQTQASGNIAGSGFATTTTNGVVIVGTNNSAGETLAVPPYITTWTAPSSFVQQINGSSGSISLATGSSLSSSSNGSTITFGLASNITTALQSAGNYLTTARASNDAIGLNTAKTNVTWTVNSSGLSLNAAGYAGTGTTFAGTNASASITLDSGGLNLALSAAAGGGGGTAGTIYFTNNTTGQSSSSSYPLSSLNVSGDGIISVGWSSNSLIISGPATAGLTQMSAGISGGNTSGNTGTIAQGQIVFAGGNNITLSGSTNGSSMTVTISGPNAGGAQTGISSIAGSGGTQTVGMVSFANSNGMTFGMSTGANSGTMTASYTVPTVTNSSWTVSDNATSLTISRLAFTQSNGLTLSLSTGAGAATVIGSYTVPTSFVQQINGSSGSISLATGSSLSSSSNGSTITFGLASNITTALQSAGAYLTTAAQSSASNISAVYAATNNTGGGTATLSGGISFSNANNATFYTSAGNAIVFSGNFLTTAAQSSASNVSGVLAATNNTGGGTATLSGNVSFSDANGFSFYTSAGNALVGSYTVPTVTQYFSNTATTFNGANISGSITLNTNGLNLSMSVAAPGGGGSYNIVSMATTTSGGQTSGTTYSQSSGTIGLVAGSNITLQQSSNSIVIFGASGGAGGNMSLYANGNTTVSSSIGSIPPTSFSLGGYGGASIGYSSTNTTGIGTIIVSAPATSSLVGTNGISVSVNGSTISVQPQFVSSYDNIDQGLQGSQTLTFNGASISYGVAFRMPYAVSASFIRIAALMTTNSTTLATIASATATGSAAIYSTFNAVVYSVGVGGSSRSLQSVASGSGGYTMLQSISMSNSTQGSYTLGFSGQAQGAGTTLTTQYSVSNSNYSFTTNQIATNFSSLRYIDIPFANSLSPGNYWLILGMSTSSASGGNAAFAGMSNCNVRYSNHYGISQPNSAWGVMGSTDLTSGGLLGAGSFSTAGGGTTASLPMSAISSGVSNIKHYFQMIRSA